MSDCIFCKIVAGQIPCYKLYENEAVLSFLDVGPLSPGHCLVIPKHHYARLDEVPPEVAGACGSILPRLGRAVLDATGASAWNVLENNGQIAGQEVDHVHFHIIPRQANDGLGYRWLPGKLDADQANDLVERIATKLQG